MRLNRYTATTGLVLLLAGTVLATHTAPPADAASQSPATDDAAKAHAAAAVKAPTPPTAPKGTAASPAGKNGTAAAFLDTEVVDVSVVNVDVYVTDRQGKRVPGLAKNDFEMFEDGKPVAITNFYAVENGKAQGVAAEGAPALAGAEPP